MQTMAKKLQGHRTGIFDSYNFPISTGRLEGTNNKIGALQRPAYGYRDRDYFTPNSMHRISLSSNSLDNPRF
jgi:transposase